MTSRILLILALAFAIQACSFKKDDGEDTPMVENNVDVIETIQKEQEKQAFEGQLTEQNVRVVFEELPTPELYKIVVIWPEQIKRLQLNVDNEAPIIFSTANQTKFYERPVRSGTLVKLTLIAFDSIGAPISSLYLEKRAPEDYVLDKSLSLNAPKTIEANRLFIYSPNQIITNGYELIIKVNKLFVIESASYNYHGLTASHIITRLPYSTSTSARDYNTNTINIEAEEAFGNLRVGLVGADGKSGINGEEIERSNNIRRVDPSKNGLNGTPGVAVLKKQPCVSRRGPDALPCEEVAVCSIQPGSGGNGLPGAAGIAGENGQDGGPTGDLSVTVKNQDEFSLTVLMRQGEPGLGGIGAPGHPGGLGGAPGINPSPCKPAARGADGAVGPKGNDGRNGNPGAFGQVHADGIVRLQVEREYARNSGGTVN